MLLLVIVFTFGGAVGIARQDRFVALEDDPMMTAKPIPCGPITREAVAAPLHRPLGPDFRSQVQHRLIQVCGNNGGAFR